MKSKIRSKSNLFSAAVFIALSAPLADAGTTATAFSFQQGDLRRDGALVGSGALYAGVVDGRLLDNSASSPLTATTTATIGNQFENQTSPPVANGRNNVGLFSYDLTELETFIAANTSTSSSVTVSSVAFNLVASATTAGASNGPISLFQTDPFTTAATWATTNGAAAWTIPYQSGIAETAYRFAGGGSALTTNLGGTSPSTGSQIAGSPLQWTTSASFVGSLNNALGRVDKKLYLMAARGLGNADGRVNVNTSTAVTVADRPELLITLAVNTFSEWTGASSTSWATVGNWTIAPATADNVRFNASSIANLSTVLNQDFSLNSIALIDPTGAVSIGGANSLTLGAGGLDLSAATQNLTVAAPLVLGAAQSWNVAASRTLNVSGVVTGSGDLTLVGAGKVSLGASNILPSGASAGNLSVSGTLNLNGTSQSINGLNGSGIVDNTGGGASVLTVGNNDAASTFGGILQDTSGTLALIKTGTGGLTLTGANDFSGGFTNNGIGAVTPNNSLAFGTGPVVSNAGTIYATATGTFTNALALNASTLRIGGGGSKTITWNGPVTATGASGLSADGGTAGVTLGSTLNIAGATFSSFANGTANTITGNISGAGGTLDVTGGTLQLGGTNTYNGTTTISGSGLLLLQATGTIASSSNIVINGTGNLTVRNTVNWVYNGSISGAGTGSVSVNTGTNATLAGSISGITGVNANSVGTNATVSGAISGAVGASVQGGATLTLAGNNTAMSGTVTLNGATAATQLNIKSATALGTGTLSIGGGTNGKIDNTSGAGLTLGTNNAQTWNSDFTFVGTNDLNLGTGAVTMGGTRGVTVTANTLTVGGAISGATFGLTKAGAGTLALSGANTYTGATNVSAGTLGLVSGSQTSAITVGATASLGFTLGSSITSSALVNLTVGTVKITGTPTLPSYLLMTASSITGTPTLFAAIPGYELVKANLDTELRLNAIGAVTGYAAWQQANGNTLGGLAADHDNDGVDNGTEYFLGGNTSTTGFTALPGVTNTGGVLSVTWTKATTGYAGTYPTDFVVQTSATLADPWTAAALGGAPDQVVIFGNTVTYTFPAGTKNFARLKVTGP